MTDPAQSHPLHPSKKSILKACGIAFIVALVILIGAILPAEYGFDPTGIGKALGFSALNVTNAVQGNGKPSTEEPEKYQENVVALRIAPGQGFEYKFTMRQGQSLLYSWTSTGPLDYEFHGQLPEAPPGEFTSYVKSAGSRENGSLVAPYDGIHGWYWENKSGKTVTVTLTTAGYYEIKGVVGAPETVIVSSR
ncbi:MAG: hypothetical protein ACYCZ0_00615 [Minisyncoccota bacterium]